MPRFEIWGHRGARGLFPENTLEAISRACALGIDGVEIDVAVTADAVPVLSHDPSLSGDLTRGPTGGWLDSGPRIRDLTFAVLGGFDVGRARPGGMTATTHPQQRPFDGARIPRLEEALGLGTRLLVELKTFPDRPVETHPPDVMAGLVAEAILRANAADRVVVESFDWRGLRWVRRHHPEIPLAFLTRAETEAKALLWWDGVSAADYGGSVSQAVAAEGGIIWAAEHETLTRERVEEAHRLALRVIGWTVNEPDHVARLIRLQADGIITDYPDVARQVVRSAGLEVPPSPAPHRQAR